MTVMTHLIAAGHACTPSACTWGEVGKEYSSAGFAVGLAVIVIAVLIVRALSKARGRR